MVERTLSHFALFTFTDSYWTLAADERQAIGDGWLPALQRAATRVDFYQVFPSRSDADVLVWSLLPMEETCDAAGFFERFLSALTPYRSLLRPHTTLWGFTKTSEYAKGRRPQSDEILKRHPKTYLIVYPFVKTAGWYQMGRDVRKGIMNEHIRIAHQYQEVNQLLLYSFGLQDQEFVVCYETEDLMRFSELVMELRSTEGRRFTYRDTPIITAVHHHPEQIRELWV